LALYLTSYVSPRVSDGKVCLISVGVSSFAETIYTQDTARSRAIARSHARDLAPSRLSSTPSLLPPRDPYPTNLAIVTTPPTVITRPPYYPVLDTNSLSIRDTDIMGLT
jgi:hypothetical protein